MPGLDVSDVLTDPDFATTFDVFRNVAEPDIRGETVLMPSTITGVSGVVVPATSNDLKRMIDVERLSGAIAIFTSFRLNAGGSGYTADIITWQGRQYTVFSADDWTQFGAGFIRATATMLSLS